MNSNKKIVVSEKAKNFLISREAVNLLFHELNGYNNTEIELDFGNIEFMSRSYADQFHKTKIDFEQNHNVKIYIMNANEEVINILQIVSKTQNSTERSFEKIPVFRFSTAQLLSAYLLSI
jgi:hypothetical protein